MKNKPFRIVSLPIQIFVFLFLVRCAPPRDQDQTLTIFFPNHSTLEAQRGGMMVYGINSERTKHFSLLVSGTGQISRTLPNGEWIFYALGWTGPDPMEGEIRCDKIQKQLSGQSLSVSLSLSMEGCRQEFFGPQGNLSGNQFYPLKLHSCQDLTNVASATDSCSSNKGRAGSVQVDLLQFELTDYSRLERASRALTGRCFSFISGNTKSTSVTTSLMLPAGSVFATFPARFRFYYNEYCSGNAETIELLHLASTGQQQLSKHFAANGTLYTQMFMKNSFTPGIVDLSLSVSPAYPNSGANWNDYVKNDGIDHLSGSDTACVGTETSSIPCLNGGMLRKVVLDEMNSCANLSLSDNLGIFYWKCRVVNNKATFFTDGFRPGKGMRNLVTATGPNWASNFVTVTDGTSSKSSAAALWWGNEVSYFPLPTDTNVIVLSSPSIVYVQTSTAANTYGYNINADKISIVSLNRNPINAISSGFSTNCKTDGETGSNSRCLFASGGQKFLWLEVVLDSIGSADYGIFLYDTRMSQISNTHIMNAGANSGIGMKIYHSKYLNLSHLRIANNSSHGIYMNNAVHNVFNDVIVSNNTSSGLYIDESSSYNSFVESIFASNGEGGTGCGIFFASTGTSSAAAENSFVNITLAHNQSCGMQMNGPGAGRNTFSRMVAVNNGGDGIYLNTPSYLTFSHLVSAHHSSGSGINQSAGYVKYAGHVLLSNNNSNCQIQTSTSPGMSNATCLAANSSTHTYHSSFVLGTSFVGKATSDGTNGSHSSGISISAYPGNNNYFDWFRFSGQYRHWGISHADTFPSSNHRGKWSTGTGQIWDWSLNASYSVIRWTTQNGPGNTINETVRADISCPSFLNGGQYVDDLMSTTNRFLLNAYEVVDDMVGDNDGLCESNEICIYAPNFGAYQGHGDYYGQECLYDDGGSNVRGVTMKFHPNNGYN